jgi:hypothetical protein
MKGEEESAPAFEPYHIPSNLSSIFSSIFLHITSLAITFSHFFQVDICTVTCPDSSVKLRAEQVLYLMRSLPQPLQTIQQGKRCRGFWM